MTVLPSKACYLELDGPSLTGRPRLGPLDVWLRRGARAGCKPEYDHGGIEVVVNGRYLHRYATIATEETGQGEPQILTGNEGDGQMEEATGE